MAFENITKLKAIANELDVFGNDGNTIVYCCENRNEAEENAQFIAYCFNLQQRFDISKLEEVVDLLKSIYSGNGMIDKNEMLEVGKLLTQIKK